MRLISLCPSITQLVFDFGLGEHLVGVTRFCIHPAEGVANIEKVGGTKDPDIQRIAASNPDLVLMNREENRREDWETLQNKGLNCHVSEPETVDETIETVLDLGRVLGVESKAKSMAEAIKVARERVHESCKSLKNKTWAYLIWRKPWMTVNGTTYINHLISETGATNVFADHNTRYPAVSAQQLAEANPDLVFLSSEPFPFKQKHAVELAELTSLPIERFRLVDGELLSWHGCFTRDGLLYAAELIGA